MESNTAKCAVDVDKPNELANAILRINEVIEHADQVVDRITGTPRPACPQDSPKEEANLRDVLAGGAGAIRDKVDCLHSKLSEIENLLF